MPAGYQPPGEGRMITLKTDDAKTPEIKIPIRGTDTGPTVTAENVAPKPAPAHRHCSPEFQPHDARRQALNNDALKGTVAVLDSSRRIAGSARSRFHALSQSVLNTPTRACASSTSAKNGQGILAGRNRRHPEGTGFPQRVLNHDNTVGQMFGATGFPTMVVIGKDGKVAAINTGNIADLETRMTGQLDALLAASRFRRTPWPPRRATPPAVDKASRRTSPRCRRPRPRPRQRMEPPKPALKFALKTVGTEKDVSNATLADSAATVLDFFAVNCGYCGKQIPRLETIRKEYESKGVRFVAVQGDDAAGDGRTAGGRQA